MTETLSYNPTISSNGLDNSGPNRVNLHKNPIEIRFEGMYLVLMKDRGLEMKIFREPPARGCKMMSLKMENSAAPLARSVDF